MDQEQIKAKPRVKLVGEDGNVFAIMGRVTKALKRAGMADEAKEYLARVMGTGSYDEALRITLEYVEVESGRPHVEAYACLECGAEDEEAEAFAQHLVAAHGWGMDDASAEIDLLTDVWEGRGHAR